MFEPMEMNDNKTNKYIIWLVPFVCIFFYFDWIKPGHKSLDLESHLNYFRDLADAFLHGRLDVKNPLNDRDLVHYNNKLYLYWPPMPAVAYTPLVAIFGTHLPDAFINILFGILNIWLFMKIVLGLNQKFNLNFNTKQLLWVGFFWGLGTVHFYMSMEGTVWFVSQIMAQTFLFSSVVLLLKSKDKVVPLLLSGLFFAAATYTRNNMVFAIFFLACLYLAMHPKLSWKNGIGKTIIFGIPFILFSLLNAWYNYVRFGDYFENGIQYHLMNPYFFENFKQHGYFSTYYLSHNFYTEVVHMPSFTTSFPFIQKEDEGFGFIWGSPLFLILIPAVVLQIRTYKNPIKGNADILSQRIVRIGCWLAALPIAFVIFCIMGTGWYQFCARYTLDFQFFLVIYLLFSWQLLSVIPKIKWIAFTLILASITIQFLGAWIY
jgi:hypothetical protein